MTDAMTKDEIYEMAVTINETADQAACAQMLAHEFPNASKQEMTDLIDDCERQLLDAGFENLNLLRSELATRHPAWAL